MKKSVARVHALIQEELDKGIDADRIVVGGFSQGEHPLRVDVHLELPPLTLSFFLQAASSRSSRPSRPRRSSAVSCACRDGSRWRTSSRSTAASYGIRCASASPPVRRSGRPGH